MCMPKDSANSLASAEVIDTPGALMVSGMRCALPMTKVTAMVSPKARPRPSITAPTTPLKA